MNQQSGAYPYRQSSSDVMSGQIWAPRAYSMVWYPVVSHLVGITWPLSCCLVWYLNVGSSFLSVVGGGVIIYVVLSWLLGNLAFRWGSWGGKVSLSQDGKWQLRWNGLSTRLHQRDVVPVARHVEEGILTVLLADVDSPKPYIFQTKELDSHARIELAPRAEFRMLARRHAYPFAGLWRVGAFVGLALLSAIIMGLLPYIGLLFVPFALLAALVIGLVDVEDVRQMEVGPNGVRLGVSALVPWSNVRSVAADRDNLFIDYTTEAGGPASIRFDLRGAGLPRGAAQWILAAGIQRAAKLYGPKAEEKPEPAPQPKRTGRRKRLRDMK